MEKNDLVLAFSEVCSYVADNMHALLLPNLIETQEMATPLFEDAHIQNIDDWWKLNNHLAKLIAYLEGVESNVEGGMQGNIDSGIQELENYPHLIEELRVIHDASHTPTASLLKYIPHSADYSEILKDCDGYRKLDKRCAAMDNVVAWPMITVGSEPKDLKSAFYLNVAILSADNTPLKPKIEKLPRFTA